MSEAETTVRSSQPPRCMCFIVELHYREPSYEARNGPRDEPYRFRYRVEAVSEQAAVWRAHAEFQRISAMSGVSWGRDVIGFDVVPVIGPHA